MPAIKVEAFSGVYPRTGVSRLEDNQAQIASNAKLQSGEIRPWYREVFVQAADVFGAKTLYKMPGVSEQHRWLTWDTDVDIVAAPNSGFQDYRHYYTGDGTPKKTSWNDSELGLMSPNYPRGWWELGTPAPLIGPSLSSSGGSGTAETRAYVFTMITTFGGMQEESAPSPPTLVNTFESGATVTISGWPTLPTGDYNFTSRRIYRAVSGAETVVYKFVAEIPIGTASYADTLFAVQLGPELESLNYDVPPPGLQGLVLMANGILAGFEGNTVYFSEPFVPHAWPSTYTLSTEYDIVGLGVFGTTLVVLTTKNPYLISGSHPLVMTQEKLSMPYSCVSKRSITYDQMGVLYASPFGLVAIGPGTQEIITTPLMTTADWQKINPTTMTSVLYGNLYLGFYTVGTARNCIVLARGDYPAMTTMSFPASAVFADRENGSLYAVSATDDKIYQLDADTSSSVQFEWKSKRFVFGAPVNFACLQVDADYLGDVGDLDVYNEQVALIEAENTAAFNLLVSANKPLGGEYAQAEYLEYMWGASSLATQLSQEDLVNINVAVYADDVLIYSGEITSFEPRRMPAGRKATRWEWIITGTTPVRSFAMATSMQELRDV